MTQPRTDYDVCIVGSGAGGGMAAYALTKAGARVVMLEAGPAWYATKNSTMILPSYATPRRGRSTRNREFGEHDACDGGFEIEGEPYTRAPGTPSWSTTSPPTPWAPSAPATATCRGWRAPCRRADPVPSPTAYDDATPH